MGMALNTETRQQILRRLAALPPEGLQEVEAFLDFLDFKHARREGAPGVALGGVLAGVRFSADEIAAARQEMWDSADDAG